MLLIAIISFAGGLLVGSALYKNALEVAINLTVLKAQIETSAVEIAKAELKADQSVKQAP